MSTDQPDGRGGLSVGQVAQMLDVTVRTLHHYDAIGLVSPSQRSAAGYRVYLDGDVSRLDSVIRYRRLGLSVPAIRDVLDGTGSRADRLRAQRSLALDRRDELDDLVAAIDAELEAEEEKEMGMNTQPTSDDKGRPADGANPWGGDTFDDYQAEAERRWGDTDAWRESRRRTKNLTSEQWREIKAEAEAIEGQFVAAKRGGLPATSPEAMAAAEAHRAHIDSRFYPCDYGMQRNLAAMYVEDPRFTAHYDEGQAEPGLAAYVRDAIEANAVRAETSA